MNIEPILSRITIYPIKSLDGISLQKAMVTKGGCLLHDREYAISDEKGNFIIGKTNPLVHTLRTKFDLGNEIVSFRRQDENGWNQFHLQNEKPAIESYLSAYFGVSILFQKNSNGRFLDIPDISGVTVLSTSSLESVSAWYNNMDLDETRKRFRATIEIDAVPPFWEDHLFSKEGIGIEFLIGNVTMFGMSPRARCVVPTRDPETGEVTHAFPKTFARHRAATQPGWSTLDEYGHHYFLTVNCYIPETEIGKFIEIGDKVSIVGEKVFY
ncbi:MAG: MOSC N-terminal beta barrel domain-containing protein [Ferruginibacter sp.]